MDLLLQFQADQSSVGVVRPANPEVTALAPPCWPPGRGRLVVSRRSDSAQSAGGGIRAPGLPRPRRKRPWRLAASAGARQVLGTHTGSNMRAPFSPRPPSDPTTLRRRRRRRLLRPPPCRRPGPRRAPHRGHRATGGISVDVFLTRQLRISHIRSSVACRRTSGSPMRGHNERRGRAARRTPPRQS